jgi:NAD(P)-dependent dehydrogenase (short-subunit alcohol dehydrogenase family)
LRQNNSAKKFQAAKNCLADRVILITGAGSGIGRCAALAYAQLGAQMVLLSKQVKKLESLSDQFETQNYPQPALVPFDLGRAKMEQYEALADQLSQTFGRLDGLVHNASILGDLSPIEHYDSKLWRKVMAVNLDAPFALTQACLPLLKNSPSSSLAFTSSGVGRKGRAHWGAYAVSKFGIEGLAQVLADELEGSTVRVNTINPGATATAMRRAAYPAEDVTLLPTPEDIMPVYIYLMCDESKQVHGQSLDARDWIQTTPDLIHSNSTHS